MSKKVHQLGAFDDVAQPSDLTKIADGNAEVHADGSIYQQSATWTVTVAPGYCIARGGTEIVTPVVYYDAPTGKWRLAAKEAGGTRLTTVNIALHAYDGTSIGSEIAHVYKLEAAGAASATSLDFKITDGGISTTCASASAASASSAKSGAMAIVPLVGNESILCGSMLKMGVGGTLAEAQAGQDFMGLVSLPTAGNLAKLDSNGGVEDAQVSVETSLTDSSDYKLPTSKAVATAIATAANAKVDASDLASAWDSATAYAIGTFVSHSGSVYMATAASTNVEPPDASYWAVADLSTLFSSDNTLNNLENIRISASRSASAKSYIDQKANSYDVAITPWYRDATYKTGDIVSYNGNVYCSRIDSNVGNNPANSPYVDDHPWLQFCKQIYDSTDSSQKYWFATPVIALRKIEARSGSSAGTYSGVALDGTSDDRKIVLTKSTQGVVTTKEISIPFSGGTLALENGLVSTYSDASGYAKNKLCVHDGVTYVCKDGYDAPEESETHDWNASEWTQVDLNAMLASKQNVISSITLKNANDVTLDTYDGSVAKTLKAGDNITLSTTNNVTTISASGGGGGGSEPSAYLKSIEDGTDAVVVKDKNGTQYSITAAKVGAQATITGAATTITSSNLDVSRALVSDSSGKVAASAVTATELGYLDGVTSNVQSQLDGKMASDAKIKALYNAGETQYISGDKVVHKGFSAWVGTKKDPTWSYDPSLRWFNTIEEAEASSMLATESEWEGPGWYENSGAGPGISRCSTDASATTIDGYYATWTFTEATETLATTADVSTAAAAKVNPSDLASAWNSVTTYAIGTFVSHNGVVYMATVANTNVEPPNATYWAVAKLETLFSSSNRSLMALCRYPITPVETTDTTADDYLKLTDAAINTLTSAATLEVIPPVAGAEARDLLVSATISDSAGLTFRATDAGGVAVTYVADDWDAIAAEDGINIFSLTEIAAKTFLVARKLVAESS